MISRAGLDIEVSKHVWDKHLSDRVGALQCLLADTRGPGNACSWFDTRHDCTSAIRTVINQSWRVIARWARSDRSVPCTMTANVGCFHYGFVWDGGSIRLFKTDHVVVVLTGTGPHTAVVKTAYPDVMSYGVPVHDDVTDALERTRAYADASSMMERRFMRLVVSDRVRLPSGSGFVGTNVVFPLTADEYAGRAIMDPYRTELRNSDDEQMAVVYHDRRPSDEVVRRAFPRSYAIIREFYAPAESALELVPEHDDEVDDERERRRRRYNERMRKRGKKESERRARRRAKADARSRRRAERNVFSASVVPHPYRFHDGNFEDDVHRLVYQALESGIWLVSTDCDVACSEGTIYRSESAAESGGEGVLAVLRFPVDDGLLRRVRDLTIERRHTFDPKTAAFDGHSIGYYLDGGTEIEKASDISQARAIAGRIARHRDRWRVLLPPDLFDAWAAAQGCRPDGLMPLGIDGPSDEG